MFNLEHSIAEWRQQMLTAGLQTPVTLEELESHLRDEIGQLVKSGVNETEAFNSAVQNIGQTGELKTEFARAGGFLNWFGNDQTARICHLLGMLWIAQSLQDFRYYLRPLVEGLYFALFTSLKPPWPDLEAGFEIALDLAGILGGLCLFRRVWLGRWIIWALALVEAVDTVWSYAQIPLAGLKTAHFDFYFWTVVNLALILSTLWLLRPLPKNKVGAI